MRRSPWLERIFYLALFYFLLFEFLFPAAQSAWAVRLGLLLSTGIMLLYLLIGLLRWLGLVRQRPGTAMSFFLSFISPPILAAGLLQLIGGFIVLNRYRFRAPGPGSYQQRVRYGFPFEGVWWVANGGPEVSTSHSWELVGQRYAYDFLIPDESGKTHRGQGKRVEDYHAFGALVLAPADGVVVAVQNHHRDCPWPGRVDPLAWSILGNYAVISHATGEFSLLAHLRHGSLKVRPGDCVRQGQVIGECGNSGHSTEPHLHFQVQDHPNFFLAASLPVRFYNWYRIKGDDRQTMSEGFPVLGDRVMNMENTSDLRHSNP
jgi:hypothetical protein